MPYQKIDGLDLTYALISFDEDGRERTDDPQGGQFSKALVEKARQDRPTDIFLFSHGWKGDMTAAIDQYNRWIGAMWRLTADRAAMGADFKPLFIGLHWPSLPFGMESQSNGTSFAAGGAPVVDIDTQVASALPQFGDKPGVREALTVIFTAQREHPGAFTAPPEVVAAYQDLAKAIGFSAGGGAGASPDTEGAPLNPQKAIQANRTSASFGTSGGGGALGGLLGGLRQLSFWTMKKRARTVGEQGMHQFVGALQQACTARIHLMGHSFGCIVVSSILGGPNAAAKLPRPVDSAALVQGALSLWSYADHIKDSTDPGYFKPVLTNGCISGPIVTTQSTNDLAVKIYYPAAVFLVHESAFGAADAVEFPLYGGVGVFGIQGTAISQAVPMGDEKTAYDFKPGAIYNLESSSYIKKMDGASGAHNDIDGPQVAHALWQAAMPAKKAAQA